LQKIPFLRNDDSEEMAEMLEVVTEQFNTGAKFISWAAV
jgi:hypothetical protein